MNKTNPIGVRFRADLLEKLKKDHGIESPQKALVFYERFFVTHYGYVRDIKSPLQDEDKKADQKGAGKPIASHLKPQDLPVSKSEAALSKEAVLKEIEAIKAEKCPKERDTPMGRRSWAVDQHKRIQELQNKLNGI